MLRILAFIALAAALAFGAVWLAERPGEVSVVWGGLTIETTLAMAAIGVVVLIVLGMMLWSLMRFMLGLPTAFSFASRARKRARGFEAVSRGMVAIGAGDPVAARRHAADAAKLIAAEPLTLLLSAQAAQLAGDKPAAEAAFKRMLGDPATRVLGLRGLFVEARRRGDQVSAHAFADEAVRLSPSLAWANDALLEHHTASGQWTDARTAVERRAALRLSDKTQSKRHRAVLLAAEALSLDGQDQMGALTAALAALKLAPGLTPAATLAGRLLAEKGHLRKAARIIETAWREQPHPDLAATYVKLRQGDSAIDRLARAQTLMKLKPGSPESAFAVAEAAIQARDFAKARAALQPLAASAATVQTCLLMARIEDAELGSAGRGREWLARSVRAPRDNAWVADGVVSEAWLPASPVSGRLDAFAWTLPPAILGSAGTVIDHFLPSFESPVQDTIPPGEPPLLAPVKAAPPVEEPADTSSEDRRAVAAAASSSPQTLPASGEMASPPLTVTAPAEQEPEPRADLLPETLPRAPDDPGAEPAPAKRSFFSRMRG